MEKALARNPDDYRIWLGLGRVAILEGDYDKASQWIRRCEEFAPKDRAACRARLDLARAAGRPDEVARILDRELGDEVKAAERVGWESWLARFLGSNEDERRTLERLLEVEPQNPEVIERLGTLAAQAGDTGLADGLRRRKGRVDEALDQYRTRISSPVAFSTVADRVEMARLAEQAGRRFDARAWCTLAARLDPQAPELKPILARLDRAQTLLSKSKVSSRSSRPHPLNNSPPRTSTSLPSHALLEFRDDAAGAGLRFSFQNGETAIHQLPETMSGGVGLLDYDGDGWLDVYSVQGGLSARPPRPTTTATACSATAATARSRT